MKRISLLSVFILLLSQTFFGQTVILSGVDGGSYNQMANDLKEITKGRTVVIEPSTGSTDNYLKLTSDPEIDLTFLQEDVMNFQQLKDLEEGTNVIENLRVLLNLGTEEIHLVVKKDSKFRRLRDLKNKRVAIGDKNQGTHITANLIKEYTSMKWKDVEIPFDSVFTWLLNDKIDAFFFVGAAPVEKFAKLPSVSNLRLLPIEDDRLEEIYTASVIPANTYKWQESETKGFSVNSLLVMNVKNKDPRFYSKIDSLLFDIKSNFEELKNIGHAKWEDISLDLSNVEWDVYENAENIFNPKAPLSDELVILSGLNGGSYNQMALDLKAVVPDIKVLTSSGSLFNMREIIVREKVFITFLQKDVLDYQKLEDLRENTRYTSSIKVIIPAGYEEIHLVANKNSHIKSLADLKGKHVGIGTVNQGTRVTSNLIRETAKLKWIDEPLPLDSALSALINQKIDAFFFVGAAPVSALNNIPTQANLELVPMDFDDLEQFYTKVVIKAGTYNWQKSDIQTYATQSVIVTNINGETKEQHAALVRLLTEISNNKEKILENGHPKWKDANFEISKVKWDIYSEAKKIFK